MYLQNKTNNKLYEADSGLENIIHIPYIYDETFLIVLIDVI